MHLDLGHLSTKEKRFVVWSSLDQQTKCTHYFSITSIYVLPSQKTLTKFTFSRLLLVSSLNSVLLMYLTISVQCVQFLLGTWKLIPFSYPLQSNLQNLYMVLLWMHSNMQFEIVKFRINHLLLIDDLSENNNTRFDSLWIRTTVHQHNCSRTQLLTYATVYKHNW